MVAGHGVSCATQPEVPALPMGCEEKQVIPPTVGVLLIT